MTKPIPRKIPTKKAEPLSTRAEASARATDGFANLVARLGVNAGRDNALSEGHYDFNLLSRNRMQLEAMYRGSWVVGAVIDSVAEDMTRAGVTITSGEAAESIEDFQAGLSRLRIMNSLQDVKKWARLYGGSIGVMMIDGQDLSSPLNIDRIQKGQFTGLTVFDRWQVQPDLTRVVRTGPDMGLPAYYTIITSQDLINAGIGQNNEGLIGEVDVFKLAKQGGIEVHHSRIIRQVGVKLPYYQAITESMWGMSEIERLHDRLVSFDTATMSAANLINHANLRTVKIAGLREVLGSNDKAAAGLYAQFDMMRYAQTNEGLTLLDGEDDFASTAYSFAGLSDMMLQFGQQLSGASGIPLVRLFGQSPAGLNSTGESDIRNYYDNINSQQESDFRPGMEKILKVAYQSMFGRPAPKDMQFTFTSLWQMSATEKATNAKTIAETVAGAFDSGLVSKAAALKELRQHSADTGVFTNITDEDIEEAENEVPMPELDVPLPDDKLKEV